MQTTNWPLALKPLLAKYKGKKHPLEYKNTYQLLVMVVLSAQDSDKHINSLAPALFKAFPDLKALAKADAEALYPFIGKVRNFGNKTNWLLKIAQSLKTDKNIPLNLDALTQLPGIGRKSANVILREAGAKAEGVIVDLHVMRVAPRLGIATGTDPKKIETQIMEVMPQNTWGEIGMAISFLGRETCRPTDPKHDECVVSKSCAYCQSMQTKKVTSGTSGASVTAANGKVASRASATKASKKKTSTSPVTAANGKVASRASATEASKKKTSTSPVTAVTGKVASRASATEASKKKTSTSPVTAVTGKGTSAISVTAASKKEPAKKATKK